MPDAIFADPRLAAIYDRLDPPGRPDLAPYFAMADGLGARRVVDVGCGTGVLACRLAARGLAVVGVDPAAASIAVARRKAHADRVRWIVGTAADLPPLGADLATMTGNVAQVFVSDREWRATLAACRRVLRPGGRLMFETRDPAREGWREWTRDRTRRTVEVPGLGPVGICTDLLDVRLPLVTFRMTFAFPDGRGTVTSVSTLRFRGRDEIAASLARSGLRVDEVRGAPDRPGRELVFVCRRPAP